MKTTVVMTTIYVPTALKGYQDNAERFGREVDYVVVGDRKTPTEAAEFCRTIPNCVFLDIPDQCEYMRRFTHLGYHIPFNCPERLNIGMLYAYEHGTDVFVMLNDDNLATEYDWALEHSFVGVSRKVPTVASDSGWVNVCDLLQEENDVEFYHRGYPPSERWKNPNLSYGQRTNKEVVMNEGFWYDDPDVDAITRLERPLRITGLKHGVSSSVALAPGTWSPLNSQNTAIARKAVPAYFQSPHIGRQSDIWAGFVICKLAEHFQDAITFGAPFATHARSPHDLWRDLDLEREGLRLMDGFCDALRGIKLSASTYHEGFGQIVEGLIPWSLDHHKTNLVLGMRLWHDAFSRLI